MLHRATTNPMATNKNLKTSAKKQSNEKDRTEVYNNEFKTTGWIGSLVKMEQTKEGTGGLASRISIWTTETTVWKLQAYGRGTTTCAPPDSHRAQEQAKKKVLSVPNLRRNFQTQAKEASKYTQEIHVG